MASKLKLGIIGMSVGNGHPYSWSAIFNGYNPTEMANCPFPVIPDYLSKESFPNNFLNDLGEVTHIWTQDIDQSRLIARASKIQYVCTSINGMIGEIDALLLARDDAENHYKYAKPFLEAGIPIYIDKPFALSIDDANHLWNSEVYEGQIFTCSALQFAKEFSIKELDSVGEIRAIWATVPKSWNKYAVHIIEPVLKLLPERGRIRDIRKLGIETECVRGVQVKWTSDVIAQFQTTGNLNAALEIRVLGSDGYEVLRFKDSYDAFKNALCEFVHAVNRKGSNIPKSFTREMVTILQAGL